MFYGLDSDLPSFLGLYWVLLGFLGFSWVFLGFTVFSWVLLGFTGFYWVLLGCARVLVAFIGRVHGFEWRFLQTAVSSKKRTRVEVSGVNDLWPSLCPFVCLFLIFLNEFSLFRSQRVVLTLVELAFRVGVPRKVCRQLEFSHSLLFLPASP